MENCTICLNTINSDDICTLSCNHSFCKNCLDTWFNQGKNTCPMCRNNINYFSHNSENIRIIYAGSLFRFGQPRGMSLFAENLNKISGLDIQLVIATTDKKSYKFIEQIQKNNKNIKFELYSNLSRREVSNLYNNCSMGLLVNNDSIHATKFTSPLKFFEYVATGLKVIATDNKAHKLLPYQESINFFD